MTWSRRLGQRCMKSSAVVHIPSATLAGYTYPERSMRGRARCRCWSARPGLHAHRRRTARHDWHVGHAADGNLHPTVVVDAAHPCATQRVRTGHSTKLCARPLSWAARSPASTGSESSNSRTSRAKSRSRARPYAPRQGGLRPTPNPQLRTRRLIQLRLGWPIDRPVHVEQGQSWSSGMSRGSRPERMNAASRSLTPSRRPPDTRDR